MATKMVDGREVPVTQADVNQMETDRTNAAARGRSVPSNLIVSRLSAAGKLQAFGARLVQSNQDVLLQMMAGQEFRADDAKLRATLTAAGADPNTILA